MTELQKSRWKDLFEPNGNIDSYQQHRLINHLCRTSQNCTGFILRTFTSRGKKGLRLTQIQKSVAEDR